jgi:hypothetical protein
MTKRPPKINLGELRASGVRNIVVFCADYTRSHSITLSVDQWADDCPAVGYRGAVCLLRLRQAQRACPAGFSALARSFAGD